MARLAALRKAAVMWIFVAIGALVEGNTNVLRLAVRSVGVALRALHLRVQSRQWIARLGVIELSHTRADADCFPVLEVVAGLTSWSQTSFVLVLVAGNATSRESQVRAVRVFDLDGRAFLRRDASRVVTLVTGKPGMLAF